MITDFECQQALQDTYRIQGYPTAMVITRQNGGVPVKRIILTGKDATELRQYLEDTGLVQIR